MSYERLTFTDYRLTMSEDENEDADADSDCCLLSVGC